MRLFKQFSNLVAAAREEEEDEAIIACSIALVQCIMIL